MKNCIQRHYSSDTLKASVRYFESSHCREREEGWRKRKAVQ